jgi:hypothetical protein
MRIRRIDRAQRIRAQRVWWERNGSFLRGLFTGVVVTAACAGLLVVLL